MDYTLITKEEIKQLIIDNMQELIGDTSVPCQLDAALRDKANINEQRMIKNDLDALKKEIERISNLVGDTSVAEQISAAMK